MGMMMTETLHFKLIVEDRNPNVNGPERLITADFDHEAKTARVRIYGQQGQALDTRLLCVSDAMMTLDQFNAHIRPVLEVRRKGSEGAEVI
jgi:hypothetical protein